MKSIAILTATRAEYGLLKPFVQALEKVGVDTRIIVTGTHLSTAFGYTVNEIESDGMAIDTRIPTLVDSDTPAGVSKTMSLALSGFADYFAHNKPDALLVLGDRYETLAVCCAAFNERIPIFHLYGGETTEGALDEAFRHSITKMSYLHFTSTDVYRNRVIQLGEDPNRVFNIGAIGVENALSMNLMSQSELSRDLNLDLSKPYAVMTYHPVTLDHEDPIKKLNSLLSVVAENNDIIFLATKANADANGRIINSRLAEFERDNDNFYLFDSLGSLRYLSAISNAAFVIGNSSSGLIEAPAFGVPTINIGTRQNGRVRPPSVIDCDEEKSSISKAVKAALNRKIKKVPETNNPYYMKGTSTRAAQIMVNTLNNQINLQKRFFDIKPTRITP